MHRLQTLGTTDLTNADGADVRSVLAQPKRFALLVYLAVEATDGYVRRDAVLGVFWPEREASRARNALNRALYFLRRSLEKE